MISISPQAKQVSGYLFVIPIWTIAVLLSEFEKDGLPFGISRVVFALGYIAIAVVTFGWGRMRGFPVKIEDGKYSGTNILRCLVVSGMMVIPVSLLAAPFLFAAAKLVQ